ncbi:MAG: hypothetical protein GY792_07840 [Gammaproteobacteria bacterium]|nr:hypothetical protein [Gammaproteobacteria bacterium]
MKTQYTNNLKTNEYGEADVNFYIAKGRRLRANAIAEILQNLIAKFKPSQRRTHQLPLNANFRH